MKFRFLVATLALGLTGSALCAPITYNALLNGANEEPPNSSPGTGFATVIYDPTAHTLDVEVSFMNLVAGTTASHIHCCTAAPGTGSAGVATQTPTFIGFPLGVTSGTYSNIFDMTLASSFNAAFITANGGSVANAEAALAAGLAAGTSYLNVHTSTYPGGEISGFLSPVPEPGGLALLGMAMGGAVELWRRRSSWVRRLE